MTQESRRRSSGRFVGWLLLGALGAGCGGSGATSTTPPIAAEVSAGAGGDNAAPAARIGWVHEASETSYPENLAGFRLDRIRCYDDAQRNCSANYIDATGSNITMYVYPVGGRHANAADPVRAEFDDAARQIDLSSEPVTGRRSWRTTAGEFPSLVLEGATLLHVGEASSMVEAALMLSNVPGDEGDKRILAVGADRFVVVVMRATYLVVTRVGPWFVKWRYTRRGQAGPEQGELGAFIDGAPVPNAR